MKLLQFCLISQFTCLLFLQFVKHTDGYSCKSMDGQNVDWFIVYKLPRLERCQSSRNQIDEQLHMGTHYMYANSHTSGWVHSPTGIDEPHSAIGRTVEQLFQARRNGDFFLSYNDNCSDSDEQDDEYDHDAGHTKGVVVFNRRRGFWLLHSVPKFFPVYRNRYIYPPNGQRYAQIFLCINASATLLRDIDEFLYLIDAKVCDDSERYSGRLPNWLEPLMPFFFHSGSGSDTQTDTDNETDTDDEEHHGHSNTHISREFTSYGGQQFRAFFKAAEWEHDLYSGLIAPQLGVPMLVQTWQNNGIPMPSSCYADFRVWNVQRFGIPDPVHWESRFQLLQWDSNQDHSKWAVSYPSDSGWVCIGDINRSVNQYGSQRGGGAVCFHNQHVAQMFHSIVEQRECVCGGC